MICPDCCADVGPDFEHLEPLLAAAGDLVRALAGHVLGGPAEASLINLRAAIDATPTTSVAVPLGEVGPDGWVVAPAKGGR